MSISGSTLAAPKRSYKTHQELSLTAFIISLLSFFVLPTHKSSPRTLVSIFHSFQSPVFELIRTMWNQVYRKDDVEAGARPLYPMMLEPPEMRWSFIRKIYSIVAIQLLATIAVAATVVSVHPIAHFFVSTGAGLALYIVLIITPFISASLPFLFFFTFSR